ncbi:hypothetical protein BuS5_01666 [Desulfosarcina sp. BuS5]|nr:hypothetical protein BuS5_01666 [Desulfosarcina sp. BuS5]
MGTHDKLLIKILRGASDANIPFPGLCNLLKVFGFDERIRGDHHIFTMSDVEEILHLQPIGSEALSNVDIIINEWIETAKKMGREIPQAKGRLLFA